MTMASRVTLCRYYQRGGCRNGSDCHFIHGPSSRVNSQVRPSPSSSTAASISIVTNFVNTVAPVEPPRPRNTPLSENEIKAIRKTIPCKYFLEGYCHRSEKCWYLHEVLPSPPPGSPLGDAPAKGCTSNSSGKLKEEADILCTICYEAPQTFGLMESCNHIFCLKCIKEWRRRKNNATGPSGSLSIIAEDVLNEEFESHVKRACPVCRIHSNYVIPCSVFPKDNQMKEKTIQNYKDAMKKKPCKYFSEGINQMLISGNLHTKVNRFCPFGDKCFFKHDMDACNNVRLTLSSRRRRNAVLHNRQSGSGGGDGYDGTFSFRRIIASFSHILNFDETNVDSESDVASNYYMYEDSDGYCYDNRGHLCGWIGDDSDCCSECYSD